MSALCDVTKCISKLSALSRRHFLTVFVPLSKHTGGTLMHEIGNIFVDNGKLYVCRCKCVISSMFTQGLE